VYEKEELEREGVGAQERSKETAVGTLATQVLGNAIQES
jgi:hypothetical protein